MRRWWGRRASRNVVTLPERLTPLFQRTVFAGLALLHRRARHFVLLSPRFTSHVRARTCLHRLLTLLTLKPRPSSFRNGYGNATLEPRTSTFEPLLNLRSVANFRTTNYLTPAVVVNRGSYESSQPDVCRRRVCRSTLDFPAETGTVTGNGPCTKISHLWPAVNVTLLGAREPRCSPLRFTRAPVASPS